MPLNPPRRGDPLRLNARALAAALRAGEAYERAKLSRGGGELDPLRMSLQALVVHAGTTDLPVYGLTRWSGPALTPADVGGVVPDLVLATVARGDRQHPVGVVVHAIPAAAPAADPPQPAGVGRVHLSGVCWARCRGDIDVGDALVPDADHWGVADPDRTSGVIALEAVGLYEEKIIPVRIDSMPTMKCSPRYNLKVWWSPNAGAVVVAVSYGGITENLSIPWNATLEAIKVIIDGHAEFVADSVECEVDGGGGFPSGNVLVSLPEGASLSYLSHTLERSPTRPFPEFTVDLCGDCR